MQVEEKDPLTQEEARSIWQAASAEDAKNEAADAAADDAPIKWAVKNEEPPAEESKAEAAKPPPSTPPAEAPVDPSILRDRVAGLEQHNQKLVEQLQQLHGKFGGLNSELSRLRAASKDANAQTPSAQAIKTALQDADAMKKLTADYPEFGGAMQSVLESYGVNIAKVVEDAVKQNAPKGEFLTRQEFESQMREYAVELASPGWRQKVVLPEFTGWLSRQDAQTSALAASDNPADAVTLVKKFDDFMASLSAPRQQDQRQRRLDSASRLPQGGGNSSVRTKSVDEMTPEEYWRYLEETDRG